MTNKTKELKPCLHCGGKDIDPEGWERPEYMDTNLPITGPACTDCGATALTAEAWNTRTNTDLEEAQAQVRVLTEALGEIYEKCLTPSESHLKSIGCEQWAEGVAETIIDKHKALSSSHIATYQAARAVIDAVNFNSGTLAIIAQGNHFGSETVTHLLKLNTALQELEHNNAGGES